MSCCFQKQIHSEDTQLKNINSKQLKNIKHIENNNERFMDQLVRCHKCKRTYSLNENKVNMLCNGCSNMFCCGIAGECIGENCSIKINGIIHRSRYCIMCSKHIINLGKICKCKKCY